MAAVGHVGGRRVGRQTQKGSDRRHDKPVDHDPYSLMDQPDEWDDEWGEDGGEEVAVEKSEDDESQQDDDRAT